MPCLKYRSTIEYSRANKHTYKKDIQRIIESKEKALTSFNFFDLSIELEWDVHNATMGVFLHAQVECSLTLFHA